MLSFGFCIFDFETPGFEVRSTHHCTMQVGLSDDSMHGDYSLKVEYDFFEDDSQLEVNVVLLPSVSLVEGNYLLLWLKGTDGTRDRVGVILWESDGDSYIHWIDDATSSSEWKPVVVPLKFYQQDFYVAVYKGFALNPWAQTEGDGVFLSSQVKTITLCVYQGGEEHSATVYFDYICCQPMPRFSFPQDGSVCQKVEKIVLDFGVPIMPSSLSGAVKLWQKIGDTYSDVSFSYTYEQKNSMGILWITPDVPLESGTYMVVLSSDLKYSSQVIASYDTPFLSYLYIQFEIGEEGASLSARDGDVYWSVCTNDSATLKFVSNPPSLPEGAVSAFGFSGDVEEAVLKVWSASKDLQQLCYWDGSWKRIGCDIDHGLVIARIVDSGFYCVLTSKGASASVDVSVSKKVVWCGDTLKVRVNSPFSGRLRVCILGLDGHEEAKVYDGFTEAGYSIVDWQVPPLPDGVYILNVEINSGEGTSRAIAPVVFIRRE